MNSKNMMRMLYENEYSQQFKIYKPKIDSTWKHNYYLKNIENIKQKYHNYYLENIDKIKQKQKEYQLTYKVKHEPRYIKKIKNTVPYDISKHDIIKCECGSTFERQSQKNHFNTKFHINFVKTGTSSLLQLIN